MTAYILPIVGVSDAAVDSGTNSGDVTIGAFGSTPTAKALSISGQVVTAQPADATHPGDVSITTQTFGGDKTITGSFVAGGDLTTTNGGLRGMNYMVSAAASGVEWDIQVPNGASALALQIHTTVALTTAGAKICSMDNHGTEKFSVDKDGLTAIADGTFDKGHITLGAYHLWVSSGGKLYIKSSAPANETDGTIVGTQS